MWEWDPHDGDRDPRVGTTPIQGGDGIPSMVKIGPLGMELLGMMDPQGGGGTPGDGGSTPKVETGTTTGPLWVGNRNP